MQPQTLPTPQAPQDNNQNFYRPSQPSVYGAAATQEAPVAPAEAPQGESVSWEASEYIHHDKDALWVVGLVIVTLVFMALALWLSAWTFAALIVVMAATMGYLAFRPPRVLRYKVSRSGITIEQHFVSYGDFRSFGVMQEGAFFTIMLTPVKRFAPATVIYFDEANGDAIVGILSQELPMEEIKPDLIDVIMRRLRF